LGRKGVTQIQHPLVEYEETITGPTMIKAGCKPDTRHSCRRCLQLGWTDGRNVRIERRWGEGDVENIRKHAAELAALAPEVILVGGSAATGPVQAQKRSI
jgi:hypothetical protein